jgi:hypothetical protein
MNDLKVGDIVCVRGFNIKMVVQWISPYYGKTQEELKSLLDHCQTGSYEYIAIKRDMAGFRIDTVWFVDSGEAFSSSFPESILTKITRM